MTLDNIDISLLGALQRQGDATAQNLAGILHLSPSQISRRKARLERQGYITGYKAQLNPQLLGLTVEAFVEVTMSNHSAADAEDFQRFSEITPEIIDIWVLTGTADYLLRVVCADLAALNDLIQRRLLTRTNFARVNSKIVMDRLKSDAPYPV